MSVNKIRDLITIIKELDFLKKQLLFIETLEKTFFLLANKLIRKISHP